MVVDEDGGAWRSIYHHVNSGGSFGANPLRQTIGLGRASRLERLETFWPTTGVTQTFTDIPLDRVIHVVEGEESYSILALTKGRSPSAWRADRRNQGMFPLSVGNVRILVRVVPTCTRGWSDAPRGGR